jgi:hypothetical protein
MRGSFFIQFSLSLLLIKTCSRHRSGITQALPRHCPAIITCLPPTRFLCSDYNVKLEAAWAPPLAMSFFATSSAQRSPISSTSKTTWAPEKMPPSNADCRAQNKHKSGVTSAMRETQWQDRRSSPCGWQQQLVCARGSAHLRGEMRQFSCADCQRHLLLVLEGTRAERLSHPCNLGEENKTQKLQRHRK